MTTIKIDGSKFEQGGRTVYALSPTISQMLQIIPERANPDVIQDANRRLYLPHGKGFGDYVLSESKWVSGALMAGIVESAITWDERKQFAEIDLNEVQLNVKLFDGQHRRYGIEYALRKTQNDIEARITRLEASDDRKRLEREIEIDKEWMEGLLEETIPVLLYVESDLVALQQMYADISHVRMPDAITVARFDARDPFNAGALELADTHPVLKGLVDTEHNSLGARSDYLLTLNQLSGVLRVLFIGIAGRNSKRSNSASTTKAIIDRGRQFFDDILKANDALQEVIDKKITPADLRARGDLSLNVTIMKVMAATWRELTVVKEEERKAVVNYLSTLPHEANEVAKGSIYIKAGVLSEGRTTPMGRNQELRKAVQLGVQGYVDIAS